MTNWLLEQQMAISLLLLILITLERKAIKSLGANVIYALWLLVPLLLIVNNLPQDVILMDDQSIYRHIVSIGANTTPQNLSFSWGLIWGLGSLSILTFAAFSQWKITCLTRYNSHKVELDITLPNSLTVVSNSQLTGPILSGIISPTLVLPRGFHSQFTKRQQHLMISHELVHFHRGDNLYNLIALVFVAIFWFNPLTWLAYRAFRRSQEIACDAVVLKQATTQDKISYSKALLHCAERSLHSFAIYSPYGEKNTMFKRIASIKNPAKIKPALVGLSIALSSTFLAGVALANLAEMTHKIDNPETAHPVTRIEPKYPVKAAQNNQEGSVILQFDIAKDGSTENVKVLESFPQQVFDKVSVAALKQWIYKPRIQGGQAQRQTGLTVQLDYRMDIVKDDLSPKTSSVEKIKVLQ
ncbi:M56 family metallopeptidase [Paraglaciecola arctica]|uniref:M56 family metallopeptidase n=1 Tax=Paraglaciecola arctica TaxID=1128911 RepID=UPI001C077CB0|nr:M56 family metallopeptidase [Paraglaciecola arctica]MBU3001939.1 M56 family metallopeptidase [Paraglaciecola arctica]